VSVSVYEASITASTRGARRAGDEETNALDAAPAGDDEEALPLSELTAGGFDAISCDDSGAAPNSDVCHCCCAISRAVDDANAVRPDGAVAAADDAAA
jgi:hypothetical protein